MTTFTCVKISSQGLEMTLLAESRARAKRPPPLVEWHRWFAWYPVPTAIDEKLHYAWLQPVERKWGIGRYSGTIKWRYRLPRRSRSGYRRGVIVFGVLGLRCNDYCG